MKRLAILFLLILFILPGCEKKKNDIEIPLPTEPPNPEEIRPTGPPF
ncbi:hypothetical protein KJ657_04520 [Patescibacteria group bacterium]|nr:hypothetical protein [Patescibacteria group bacterium]MBU1016318.1 hypothetical protein [Patescibacteria group bacterium]MBU1685021.1 hypothetical protein [Patescibacteria group bacterium]MBU1938829.1 hypothetical protein [Patescibacteria group bacterium]